MSTVPNTQPAQSSVTPPLDRYDSKQLAGALGDFVNAGGNVWDLALALSHQDRTLQAKLVDATIAFLDLMQYNETDFRNEAAVKVAKAGFAAMLDANDDRILTFTA